mmetsp:Transcript_22318/g.19819  ORF Transcript_22318/g.19819 Transcript_22318/m.19819 type:complete len:96 (+) Transcript_22318:270-557(+)
MKASESMFSPGNKATVFSPDTKSKGSLQSRIELHNVIKEAQAFLSEPDVIYEPPKENLFVLKDCKYDVYKMSKPKHQMPKVESIEEFVKSRKNRS